LKLPEKSKYVTSVQQFCHPTEERKINQFDFTMNDLPIFKNYRKQECDTINWMDTEKGYIINTGCSSETADTFRFLCSITKNKKTKNTKEIMYMVFKQHKIMLELGPSHPNQIKNFKSTIKKSREQAYRTYEHILEIIKEEYGFLFIMQTNFPFDLSENDLKDIPEDTIIFTEKGAKEYYSPYFYSIIEAVKLSDKLEKIKYQEK